MTLAYEEQDRLAEKQDQGFRDRIPAGAFTAAVTAYGQAPNPDATKQAQRMALVNALVKDPGYGKTTFAWLVVSRPTVNTSADLTDAFIATTIGVSFDSIASQLFIDVKAPV